MRQRHLRPHERPEEIVLPGDDDARSGHFGAFDAERLVAVASIVAEPDAARHVMRLRGVATEADARGGGHGRAVVEAALAHGTAAGARFVWLHTTPDVVPWYAAMGFEALGAPFPAPRGRTYQRMARALGPLTSARRAP